MLEIQKYDKIIVANWKLNGSFASIEKYLSELKSLEATKANICGVICPPSIYLHKFSQLIPSFYLGSQDCSNYEKGAYTGEISASMINDISCRFCIVGHSERRQFFNQKNIDIQIKVQNLIQNEVNPIICVGESIEEKNKNLTKEVLYDQISHSIPKNIDNSIAVIAYEPIWAIGSGLIPTMDEINEIHIFIKKEFKNFKVIYGGSVKANNAKEILSLQSVDGVLVGGASLDAIEFNKIMNF